MRIDLVITELFVGGAEKCLTELALGLRSRGDQVRVFSLAPLPVGPQRQLVDRLEAASIPVASGDALSSWEFFRVIHRLRRWLQDDPPELVQTFLFHGNVAGTRAARQANVPRCVGGIRVAERKPMRCWLERREVARMDAVICVSDQVQEFAVEHLKANPDRCFTIANGIDAKRFATADGFCWSDLDWPDDSIVTLFVGRMHPQKGIERLQEQIEFLVPPGGNKRLLLVGEGPLSPSIDTWIRRRGDNRVVRLPWQADVAPLMKACRVLILPSYYEGMPNVVLEAMAAGKPVVCSRVEGVQQLLQHDLQRQSFAVDDVGAMKNLIAAFLNDEALADEAGLRNQQRVEQEFSLEQMVDAYRDGYRVLLAGR